MGTIITIAEDIAVAAVMGGWLFLGNPYCENAFKFFCWFLFVIIFISAFIDSKKLVKNPTRDLIPWAASYDVMMVMILATRGEFLYAGLQAFSYLVSHSQYRAALAAKEAETC